MKQRLALICAALAATVFLFPGAARAQTMVLGGSTAHPTGQRLSPETDLTLAQGERLLLLTRGAGTRLVCGPYRGRLAAARDTCARIPAEIRIAVAAERGRGGFDDLFDILTAAGVPEPITFCVNPDAFLTDHDMGEGVLRVLVGDGARQRRVRWPTGQTNFTLRPRIQPRDGLLVTLLYGSREESTPLRLRLRIMPAPLALGTLVRLDEEAMIVADMLHDLGCTHQEAAWLHNLQLYESQGLPFVLFNP